MKCKVGEGVPPEERAHQRVNYSRGYEEREEGVLTFMEYMYPREGLISEEPVSTAEANDTFKVSPTKLKNHTEQGHLKRYRLKGNSGFYLPFAIERSL